MTASTTNQWKLGLFLLSGFVMIVAVAVWFGARRFQSEIVIAYSYFDEPVTGLDVGSPVRFRGMTIGSIKEIRVAPDRHHLEVACAIDVAKLEQIGLREPGEIAEEGVVISSTLRTLIERSFVTGVAFLQTDFFDPERYPLPTYPFEVETSTIHSVPSPQQSLQKGLEEMLITVPRLIEGTQALVDTLEHTIDESDIPALSAEVRETLDDVQEAMEAIEWKRLDEAVAATLDGLRQTLDAVQRFVDETRAGEGPLAELVEGTRSAIDRLEQEIQAADLPGTTASLRRLADGYTELVPEAADLLPTLRRTAESFRRLADMIERDPSSLVRGRATPPDPRNGR